MYANVITTRFKSPEDLETAVEKLEQMAPDVEPVDESTDRQVPLESTKP